MIFVSYYHAVFYKSTIVMEFFLSWTKTYKEI